MNLVYCVQFSSVRSLSCVRFFVTPWTAACRPPCPSPTSRAHSSSCPLSQCCHPTISSSVVPFSSYLPSFLTSESFHFFFFFKLKSNKRHLLPWYIILVLLLFLHISVVFCLPPSTHSLATQCLLELLVHSSNKFFSTPLTPFIHRVTVLVHKPFPIGGLMPAKDFVINQASQNG